MAGGNYKYSGVSYMENKSTITWILIAITIILAIIAVAIYYYRDNYKKVQYVKEYRHSKIYNPNSQWNFLIKNSKFNDVDTLVLQDIEFDANKALTIYRWKFLKKSFELKDENENIFKVEVETSLNDNNNVILYFPSIDNLDFLKLFPEPSLSYPLFLGKFFTYKRNDTKEIKGLSKYEESIIEARYKITDKILYESNFLNDTCWFIMNDTKTNQGNFTSKYYFHEKYGFVYLFYDFNDFQVELSLIDAKISE